MLQRLVSVAHALFSRLGQDLFWYWLRHVGNSLFFGLGYVKLNSWKQGTCNAFFFHCCCWDHCDMKVETLLFFMSYQVCFVFVVFEIFIKTNWAAAPSSGLVVVKLVFGVRLFLMRVLLPCNHGYTVYIHVLSSASITLFCFLFFTRMTQLLLSQGI